MHAFDTIGEVIDFSEIDLGEQLDDMMRHCMAVANNEECEDSTRQAAIKVLHYGSRSRSKDLQRRGLVPEMLDCAFHLACEENDPNDPGVSNYIAGVRVLDAMCKCFKARVLVGPALERVQKFLASVWLPCLLTHPE